MVVKLADFLFNLGLAAVYLVAFYCYLLLYFKASDQSVSVALGLLFLTAVTGFTFIVTSRAIND